MLPAPIYTYLVLTVLLPVIFRLINRKFTWLSIICAAIMEIIMYWDHFCYYESRGLMMYMTLIQIVIMSIIAASLNLIGKKKERK